MKELINITILLCKDCDENITNINKIFDNVVVEGNKTSFDIVTIVNAVEYTKSKFSLHYFLLNLENDMMAYVGEDAFEQSTDEEKKETQEVKSSVDGCSQKVSVIKLDNVEFLSSGSHEILVYKYEDDEVEMARTSLKKEGPQALQVDEKLVATYSFKVKYKDVE